MEKIYFIVAAIVYSIFIIRFILSWIGGDFEIDSDLDVNDIVSFKGFTHFLMGVSGWLSIKSLITHNIVWYDYIISLILGCIFVIILYYVYKLMIKLESKPIILKGKDLIGYPARIYLCCNIDVVEYKYIITLNNGNGTVELNAKSYSKHNVGDVVFIKDYDGAYYIIN